MSAPWFRSTDLARWGASNSGGDLSATQFDENTWFFYQAIVALQALPGAAAGIDHFTIVGNQLTVTMTDHTTRGPYTIPVSAFNFRGAWQPSTTYIVNDVITANGAVYIVIFNHVSQLTFSAGANDGLGDNYYGLMLALPGSSLPTGGAVGQMLVKTTVVDFATSWGWPLPTGGTAGQALIKNSSTNQDASWITGPWVSRPPASPAGISGQILSTTDGSDTHTRWIDQTSIVGLVHAPPVSPAGIAGQLLATVDGTPTNMEWVDPPTVVTALADLTDVLLTSPVSTDFLTYNGSHWVNTAAATVLRNPTTTSLGATGSIFLDPTLGDIFTLTPTGDLTITATSTPIDADITIIILTSGTTSHTITFSSGTFKSVGTLVTGTVSGKYFTIRFVGVQSPGFWLVELSRTAAM